MTFNLTQLLSTLSRRWYHAFRGVQTSDFRVLSMAPTPFIHSFIQKQQPINMRRNSTNCRKSTGCSRSRAARFRAAQFRVAQYRAERFSAAAALKRSDLLHINSLDEMNYMYRLSVKNRRRKTFFCILAAVFCWKNLANAPEILFPSSFACDYYF